MKKRKFGKALMLFSTIFILTLAFAGCNQDAEDEGESGGGSTSGATRLVENAWTDGKISKEGQLKKYTFEVTKGARYFIWLNDSSDGDRTKDADVGLKISHEDGTVICGSYNDASSLYTKPLTFSASSTGTVTITAAAYKDGIWNGWETGTGSYAIKYTSRPESDEIFEGEWKDDSIIATGQTNKYTFYAAEKTRYFIYLDDTDAGSGITTKTANVGLKITHSDGTTICNNYNDASSIYSQPYTFIASSAGIITITAAAYKDGIWYGWEYGTGTYAIKYTSRQEYITLTEGQWENDSIITNGQTNKYSIPVMRDTSYSIYLNDIDEGDGTKTANVGLKIFYNQDSYTDNPIICNDYGKVSKHYSSPYTFTASSTGTITITAAAYKDGIWYGWEYGTGTYAIKYTIADSESDSGQATQEQGFIDE